ncbi:RidA family protein [Vagococcus coleopterorum]|uniref:RidA family protein n=2 Tax=Vagococcus coleopterorum TaxID=2714946 RepID=A0A6G8API7_9ENTE|nr:RidA family protein [Vagococcus coleopterorum]
MKTINTTKAPSAIGPYVQGKIVNGFLFASGQVPINPATGEIEATTIEGQTKQVMENITAILEEAGTSFDNIVKTTCFVTDLGQFAQFNENYAAYFGEELPARSCVQVAGLPKGALVEVEVIATVK